MPKYVGTIRESLTRQIIFYAEDDEEASYYEETGEEREIDRNTYEYGWSFERIEDDSTA